MKKNKPLRVAIDGHMLGDKSGGNETYYRNVLQNMVPDEGMELVLFVKEGTDVSAYEDRFEIVYFPNHRASIRNMIDIPIMCIKNHIDVLHMQYFIPFICPCPVVTTIHDICFEHFKDIFTTKEYIRQKVLVRHAAEHSESIITVSNYSKKDISECYSVCEDRITVTYNAVDENYRKLTLEELDLAGLSRQFGIKGKYILSVCNLQPRKNLKRLISAYCKLCQEFDYDGQLVIVGKKAWMYDEILTAANAAEESLKELTDGNRIVFTDYVDEADLIRLYNGAQCFVYPSYFEGFGIPPLEALACGTPVAVSRATSLPEVVGDAGVYFDPFNVDEICETMHTLIENAGSDISMQNHEMQEEIEAQASKYSWIVAAEKVKEVYEQTASQGKPKHIVGRIAEVYEHRDVLSESIKESFNISRGNLISWVNTFSIPIILMFVYSLIFNTVLGMNMENYKAFIIVALVPWYFFYDCVTDGSRYIRKNKKLLTADIPVEIFTIAYSVSRFMLFLGNMLILLIYMFFAGFQGNLKALVTLPVIMITEYIFALGISMIVTGFASYNSGIHRIITIIVFVLQFFTPVLYEAYEFPESMWGAIYTNPMTYVIDAFRSVLYYNEIPEMWNFFKMMIYGLIALIIGWEIISRRQMRVRDKVLTR